MVFSLVVVNYDNLACNIPRSIPTRNLCCILFRVSCLPLSFLQSNKCKNTHSGSRPTCVLGVEHLQGMHHGTGKYVGILLAAEVKAVDLSGVAPLVEGQRGLVVLQPLGNGTVYHHLETSIMSESGKGKGENND